MLASVCKDYKKANLGTKYKCNPFGGLLRNTLWRCFLGHPDRRLLQVCFQMLRQILWAGTSHAKGIVVEKIGIEAKQSLAL